MRIVASIHAYVFDLVKNVVSGMAAVSLSLADVNQMTLFRAPLKRVIAKKLVFVSHPPSKAAERYRRMVLDTFLGGGAQPAALRLCLVRCASGDWRMTDCFQFVHRRLTPDKAF